MEFNTFLLKYAEIGVKGKNRYLFEDALVRQIRYTLAHIDGDFKVYKSQGRIFAAAQSSFDFDEAVDRLCHVFGLVGICPVWVRDNTEYEQVKADVVTYMKEMYPEGNFTFKCNARRGDKHYPHLSPDMNMDFGEVILDAIPTSKVDVHSPEVLLNVEVREKIYIYSKIIPGPGGMPVGTAGKGMLLLSGGIDSPVAGYMIGKRGVKIDAVYFHAPPYTSDRAKQKVIDLAKIVSTYTGPINLHIINFTDIQLYIYEKCQHDQLTIIMRRYMMKIAEHIAKENECLGLITGESIGQVASQTMHSLAVTNEVCTLPVFRPCIGMDKQEIVDISEKIGSYETSILPFEDCCTIFVAKHPVTKPSLKMIQKSETHLAEKIDDLMKAALESDEVITVSRRMHD